MSSLLCECVSYIHSLNNTSSPTSCGYVLCVTIQPFLVNIFLNFHTPLSTPSPPFKSRCLGFLKHWTQIMTQILCCHQQKERRMNKLSSYVIITALSVIVLRYGTCIIYKIYNIVSVKVVLNLIPKVLWDKSTWNKGIESAHIETNWWVKCFLK